MKRGLGGAWMREGYLYEKSANFAKNERVPSFLGPMWTWMQPKKLAISRQKNKFHNFWRVKFWNYLIRKTNEKKVPLGKMMKNRFSGKCADMLCVLSHSLREGKLAPRIQGYVLRQLELLLLPATNPDEIQLSRWPWTLGANKTK